MRSKGKHYLIRAHTIDDLKEKHFFLDGKGNRTNRHRARRFSRTEASQVIRTLRREPWVSHIRMVPA